MLLALTYYIVPRVTNTPLYSYTLSLISFWGMAFFYTGVGDHHILQSPTPAWLKTIATVSSWMLLVPVFAFTINILGTMKGNWDRFFTNLPCASR
jgi:cytochrome c oxidase cbb3-type subunit I/II